MKSTISITNSIKIQSSRDCQALKRWLKRECVVHALVAQEQRQTQRQKLGQGLCERSLLVLTRRRELVAQQTAMCVAVSRTRPVAICRVCKQREQQCIAKERFTCKTASEQRP